MKRRAFLQASPKLNWVDEPAPIPSALTTIRIARRAMATKFEIVFPLGTHDAVPAAEDALDLIDELEDQLSVYRESSEISQLNANAATEAVVVEAGFFQLLERCAVLTRETDGAFDAATGSLVDCWGFSRREGRIPAPLEWAKARECSGFRHVILDSETRTVRYRKPGLRINFGGIGKGYALDRAADLLRTKWGIRSALLHGGGSSVYAMGMPPNDLRGWPIAIRHPTEETRHLATLYLKNQGLGTSAATFQFFEYKGKKYGHLLNPLSGRPAEGTASASCVANTAAEADALSTAMFVRGETWAKEYCQSRSHLTAVVLNDDEPSST